MKFPPGGYRLDESDTGVFGAMWMAYAPDGTNLGACGGGTGKNAGSRNKARVVELCWAHYGRAAAPAIEEMAKLLEKIAKSPDDVGPLVVAAAHRMVERALPLVDRIGGPR